MDDTNFCPNCGNAVATHGTGAARFCARCGTNLRESGQQDILIQTGGLEQPDSWGLESGGDFVSGPENNARKGRKTWKLPVILGSALIIVAAAVFAGITAFAGNSYQKAEAEYLSSLFNGGTDYFAEKGTRADFDIEYIPSAFLSEYIPKMALEGNASALLQMFEADISFRADGKTVSDINAVYDGSVITIGFPGISGYYLQLLEDSSSGRPDITGLDRDALEANFENIAKAYFEMTNGVVETQKGVELSSGGITVKCDMHTINFTEEMVSELLVLMLNEFENNTNLMDYITNYLSLYELNYEYEDAKDLFEDMREWLEDLDAGSARLFRMKAWTKGGTVIGRKIDAVQNSDFEFFYQKLVDGGNMNIEAGTYLFDFEVSLQGGFKNGDAGWNGILELYVNNDYYGEIMTLEAECENLRKTDNRVSGFIDITAEYAGNTSLDISIALDDDDGRQTAVIEGGLYNGYDNIDLGTLSFSYTTEEIESLQVNQPRRDYVVIYGDYSYENAERAQKMLDELDEAFELGRYDENELLYYLAEMLWYFADDIIYYSDSTY